MLRINIENSGSPISYQIYDNIKKMVLKGVLAPGEQLPSSRIMAKELKISRNTVLYAYDWLISEGYAVSNSTSGTYIAGKAFLSENIRDYDKAVHSEKKETQAVGPAETISFETGIPALELVPKQKLGKIARDTFINAKDSIWGYDYPEGRPELRETIASYLKKTRNINCHPEQLMITSGTKQGMTLIAKCLLDETSAIAIEDPSFTNIRRIFGFHCRRFFPVPTDEEGMITSQLPSDINPTIIFTTPSHQIPMGGILSIQRRLEILEYAYAKGCYVIEDDYDSEFNYDNKFISTIKELDVNNEKVIYAGTFSKVLYPSLRMGYLVLPEGLAERFREVKRLGDQHTNTVNQLILNAFIEEGQLSKHILRMKKIYKRKRDFLIKALRDAFGDDVGILGSSSGMHIVARLKNIVFSEELVGIIRHKGVILPPVIEEVAMIKGRHLGEIALGYTNLSEKQLADGVRIIKEAVEAYAKSSF